MMIAVLVLMLIVELLNSAIEAVVDRVSLERHALSKNAKDFGSAAVLLTFLLAVATWAVILFDRFYLLSFFFVRGAPIAVLTRYRIVQILLRANNESIQTMYQSLSYAGVVVRCDKIPYWHSVTMVTISFCRRGMVQLKVMLMSPRR